jgi:Zn-dependent M28 family amino/carboxypeptidase
MMRRVFGLTTLLALVFCTLLPSRSSVADEMPALTVDPQIAAAVGRISADDLRKIDTRLVGFGTRNLFSEGSKDPKRGVFPARDWIAAQFRDIGKTSGGRLSVALDTFLQPKTARTPRDVETSSVIATLKGEDPQRGIIVISSHYDSRNSDGNDPIADAPGADDNGSGTSAVLEAARVLAPLHFPATIVFACFDGEEQGLFGSAHYAKSLKDAGLKVEANLNNDIIGASLGHGGEQTPNDVRLFNEALAKGAEVRSTNQIGSENDSPSRELARAVKEIDFAYLPEMSVNLIFRSDRFLRGGDQQSFADQGFAAVRYVEQHENYEHQHQNVRLENAIQYGDTLDRMDFAYLARVTGLNVAALATLASAPAAPAPGISNKELSYDSTLQWTAIPSAAAYEIVWRATYEPVWTHARNVGNVTNAVIKGLSKDDWIFGVRAIDAAGHRSVAAYPQPFR